jgi:hypothetical protein
LTTTLPILVAEDVAAVLGAEATLVRTGEAFTDHRYNCMACRTDGDFREEPAAAVAFLGPDEVILALIHARCGDSATYPAGEMAARFGRPDDPAPAPDRSPVPDTTAATVVQLRDGTLYPALVITPGSNVRAFAVGSSTAVDSAVEQMRAEGFGEFDLTGGQWPVELDRWSVRLDAGRLAEIRKPGGLWWVSDPPRHMPVQWRDAAKDVRRCVVLILGSTMPEGDLAALRAAMSAAASAGGLVGALLPVRGTFS